MKSDVLTVDELVERLKTMRESSDQDMVTVNTQLFGLLFHKDIGNRANQIATAYEAKGYGRINHVQLRSGMIMAPYVDPHFSVLQKWRSLMPSFWS